MSVMSVKTKCFVCIALTAPPGRCWPSSAPRPAPGRPAAAAFYNNCY